jgi:RNase P subunit RPR2
VAPADREQHWYFGVICERCATFIPIARDPSDGRPGARFAGSGTVIVTCATCGERGRYQANRVEQRRSEGRRSDPPH